MTDEQIIQLLNEEIDGAVKIQDELTTLREDYYKRFRAELYGNERDGWSKSIHPVVWNTITSLLPSFMEVFRSDFFNIKSDNDSRANKFKKLLRYQLFRKQDGRKRIYEFLFDALIGHYGVMKCYKKDDYDLVTEKYDRVTAEQMIILAQQPDTQITKYTEATDEASGQLLYENVKVVRKKTIYSGPYVEVVPPWEFFYSKDCIIGDWGAITGKLVMHRVKRTLDYVRKKEKAGVYVKGAFELVKDKAKYNDPKSQEEVIRKYDADDLSEPPDTDYESNQLAKEVEIDECYFMFDIDNDGLLEHCIVHKCDDVMLSKEENPYGRPPFRIGSINPEPHKVTGIPLPDVLDNDQRVMTNLLRLIQDSAAQSCYRNPVTDDHQMFTQLVDRKPFAVIKGNPEKLGEVKMSDPSQFILKAWELVRGEIEEKTGVTRYNQGLDADSLNKTATGVQTISAASLKKQRMTISMICDGVIKGMLRDFIFINQKWPGNDPMILLGEDMQINKEDLDGEYDIEIDVGVGPAERQAMAQQMDLLVQFGTQAGLQMGLMEPIHILRAQKKKYNLLDVNIEDCMVSEDQFKQKMEEQKKQPPKEDWKEFVQMDKLYPSLTRNEQMQILVKMGIQPDQQGQVAGLPQARDIIQAQSKQQGNNNQMDAEIRMREAEQKMGMEREKHQMDLEGKRADLQHKKISSQIDIMGKVIDRKIKNNNQSIGASDGI